MQVKEVFGDYQLHPYNVRKTPRLILIAEKEKSSQLLIQKHYLVMEENRIHNSFYSH